MPHPNWCGKPCSECDKYCELDMSIPCSPDCPQLNPITGEPDGPLCKTCDAYLSYTEGIIQQ
ncbi:MULTISPECIES: hypothetical protein [Clostridium]|jgi:hypothetical protein|uniref:hypothetical protein n=1 Tax=Clostridium TaxID=1485 RepID=UPI002433126D|nr:hypothetical protein [Clostridium tyrobutyricum]